MRAGSRRGIPAGCRNEKPVPGELEELEERGIRQACLTHVLAPQALPHQLKTRERGTMALSVCARSHPPTRGSRRPTCVCLQPRVTGCAPRVRAVGAWTWRCVFTAWLWYECALRAHACAHAHERAGMPEHAGALRGWAACVWAGVCCAQAPPDGALPPCHLLGTQTCTLRGGYGADGHCPLWGDDTARRWSMGAWQSPHHTQGRVTATVTPASANVVYEMIRVVGQPLGGTGRGGVCCRGGPRGDKARAWGSCEVCAQFGWVGSSPLPYCVRPCWWLSHTWHFWVPTAPSVWHLFTCPEQEMLDSHPRARGGTAAWPPSPFPGG